MWESRDHSDVTLVVAGTRIPTHRVILASQSEYFDRLLFGEMREAHAGAEIPLPDTPLEAFQLLLRYAYCGSLEMKTAKLRVIDNIWALLSYLCLHAIKLLLKNFPKALILFTIPHFFVALY